MKLQQDTTILKLIPAVQAPDSVITSKAGSLANKLTENVTHTAKALNPASALHDKASSIKGWVPSLPDKKIPSWKEFLSGHQFSITNEGIADRTYFGNGYYYMNNLLLTGSVNMAKIPLKLQYLHQDYFAGKYNYTNTFQVQFDKDGFLDNYRKKLKEKFRVDDLVPKDELLENTRNAVSASMRSSVDSMKNEYSSMFGKTLPGLDTINNFLDQDVNNVFQSQLTLKKKQLIKEKEEKLRQLTEKAGTADPKDLEQAEDLKKDIAAYYKMVEYYNHYRELSKKFDLKGLNKKLVQEQLDRARKYEELLSDPSSLKSLAEKNLPVTGMEKFFMNVQRLNAGQQTVSISELSVYNYLHKGISMEVLKDNKYFFLLAGKEQDLNAVYDRAAFTSLSQNDHTAVGIRTGKGGLTENHSHVSLFSFKQSRQLTGGNTFDMPRKSAMVLGLSNRFNIDESSAVEMELSRSAVVYDAVQYGLDTTGRKSAFTRLLGKEDFAQSLAVTAKYKGNFTSEGLNINAGISHVAAGYYNPGNPFLARGAQKAELSVRKSLWKKKLVINLRGNWRQYSYATTTDSKWRNTSLLADARLKLPGGQQLGVKYQPVRGFHITKGSRILNNASDRVTVEVNLQQRLGNLFYRNMLNTVYNSSRYLGFNAFSNVKTLTFSSLQSVAIGTHLIFLNNTYTYAQNPSAIVFLNSSYNADGGFTYKLGEKCNASSAINYSSTTGWYRQLGARQTFTATLTSKLDVSFFIDAKMNITQQSGYGYYDDMIRADWSLKYNF